MVQVTVKPVNFNDDVKAIFKRLEDVARCSTLFVSDFRNFLEEYQHLKNFVTKLDENSVGDAIFRFKDLIETEMTRVYSDMLQIVRRLEELNREGLLKEEYVDSYRKSFKNFEDVYGVAYEIKERLEDLDYSLDEGVIRKSEAVAEVKRLFERFSKKLDEHLGGGYSIHMFEEWGGAASILLGLYAMDPPEGVFGGWFVKFLVICVLVLLPALLFRR